jgi:aminopeptidase YwaD
MRYLLLFMLSLFFVSTSFAQNPLDRVKGLFSSSAKDDLFQKDMEYLNSEALSSRSTGNLAEAKAAKYISNRMAQMKLQPYQGKYIQPFKITNNTKLSDDSYVEVFNKKLAWGKDILNMPYSGSGAMSAMALPGFNEPDNIWFIKFSELGAELNNPRGDGPARMHTKAELAIKEGAMAVFIVNDIAPIADFKTAPTDIFEKLDKPVIIMSYDAYMRNIVANNKQDWINVKYDLNRNSGNTEGKNVVGYWSNRAKETIVIGAHYDGLNGEINTTGMAALLKVIEYISSKNLQNYNYMFIAFSGHYVNMAGAKKVIEQYMLDNSKINCMIDINDIGMLEANNLNIKGAGTSPDWSDMLVGINLKYTVSYDDRGAGYGDFEPFYRKDIPVLSFSTPINKNPEYFNINGALDIAESIGNMLAQIDNSPKLRFAKTKEMPKPKKLSIEVSMGAQLDYNYMKDGVRIASILENKAGAQGGLQAGDVIIRMDAYDIRDIDMYMDELAKYKKGSTIMLTVLRNQEQKKLVVTFD